ncbi:hypothetical protein, partial [Helicobacter felis]|uniref:hypothetical protein n=1 Tax=Helicobacter felis TaxID=214 RepID=UPI001F227BBB
MKIDVEQTSYQGVFLQIGYVQSTEKNGTLYQSNIHFNFTIFNPYNSNKQKTMPIESGIGK